MLGTKITLCEIAKRLTMHAEVLGDWSVSSIGYASNHYHVFALRNESGQEMDLNIPMYENTHEARNHTNDGDEIKESGHERHQYMLIYACEIELSRPRFYDSMGTAFDAMITEFSGKSGIAAEILKKHYSDGTLDELSEEFRDDYAIKEEDAWIMDGENHDNHIWKIYRCTMKGNRVMECE